jgi:hypothetical protein
VDLSSSIEELTTRQREARARLRAMLSEQLNTLEED